MCKFANSILLALVVGLLLAPVTHAAEPPFQLPPTTELSKLRSAVITTSKGTVYCELFPDEAPWHVANLKFLADRGFFKGGRITQYMADYIVQGGGMRALPDIAPYSIPAEFNSRQHERGSLGMARRTNEINPERRSTYDQFHLLLGRAPHMDGHYTVFGKVVGGTEAMQSLRIGDEIKDLKVFVRPSGISLDQ